MNTKHSILALVVLLAPLACGAGQEVASVGPQSPHPLPAGAVVGPYVQAGTQFSVRLDQPIDTFYSAPGTKFTATVNGAVQGPDGQLIVPRGAKVRGVVASVGDLDAPMLRINLESIDTVAGPMPLHAAVRTAQHHDWAGPPTPAPYEESFVYPFDFSEYGTENTAPDNSLPGGRTAEGRTLMQPREINVPAGAVMQLRLSEPIVLPGARLAR